MNPTELDPVLLPYCEAQDENEAQRLLTQLVTEQMEPIIRAIVRHKLGQWLYLRHEEVADVQGEVLVRLLPRLQRLRQGEDEDPIENLEAYVAVTSYHGCAAYLRQHAPQRWYLQNRLRYLLTSQPQFRLRQEADGEWIGGLASWKNTQRVGLSQTQAQQLLEWPPPLPLTRIPDPSFRRTRPEAQLHALLEWVGHWLTLDELVAIFALWWDIKDQPTTSLPSTSSSHTAATQQIEQRLYLQEIWQRIVALPVRQRQVLLLNLREVGKSSVITLLPALQIASLRELATALEMSLEELAALWPRLPLADREIAARLQITRRQVINLRNLARLHLARGEAG